MILPVNGNSSYKASLHLPWLSAKLGSTLPFTRQEIADMAGTATETAIRVMSRLKAGKIIGSVRGKVIILDETKLKVLSEGTTLD